MNNSQITRRLEALETLMDPHDDTPKVDIEIVFVEPVEGCFGGRITRTVRLSELQTFSRATKGDQQ